MKAKLTIDEVVRLVRDDKPPLPPPGKSEIFFPDNGLPTFGIRILRSGVAAWRIRPFIRGRQRPVTIGDVRAMTRKDAIQRARRMIVQMEDENLDPAKAKRDAIASAKRTFKVVVADFLERKEEERIRPATLTDYKNLLRDKYHSELFQNRPFDEIGHDEFEKQKKVIKRASGDATALKWHAAVKYLYNWAIETNRFPDDRRNPLDKVEAPVKNRPRDRVLTSDEIRLIWKTCDDWEAQVQDLEAKGIKREPGGFNVVTDYPRATQLLFLTGMRSKEMGDLHWSEVNLPDPNDKNGFGEINLLSHRTKEKRPKCIPLVPMAVKIFHKIEKRPGDPCVFGRGDGRPIELDGVQWKEGLNLGDTERKITNRIKRGDTGFWKHQLEPEKKARIIYMLARGDISMTRIRKEERIRFQTIQAIKQEMEAGPIKEAPPPQTIANWTLHDIRRTFRTGLAECGVPLSIAERFVGHLDPYSNRTERTYNKYEYWKEKCDAASKWEARLKSILRGTEKEIQRSKSNRKAA
jgi:integrase